MIGEVVILGLMAAVGVGLYRQTPKVPRWNVRRQERIQTLAKINEHLNEVDRLITDLSLIRQGQTKAFSIRWTDAKGDDHEVEILVDSLQAHHLKTVAELERSVCREIMERHIERL